MNRFILLIIIGISSFNHILAQDFCAGVNCMPAEIQNECTVMQSNGCIDWNNGVIYATGMGVPNPKFPTQAQRSYSAYEAAKTVAMRNLLQMVQDINITSTKTVKAGMLENDVIQTQITGRLRHVQEVGKPKAMNDGSIWVTMKHYLRDIRSILVNNQQFEFQQQGRSPLQPKNIDKKADQSAKRMEVEGIKFGGSPDAIYSGLVIDARGTGLVPAMSPKILDQNGNEIYGSAEVERDFVLKYGIAGYVKDLKKAVNNQRVKGNPLVIKAKISSGKSSDLTISDENAELIKKLDATQTFLREARVVIVIS